MTRHSSSLLPAPMSRDAMQALAERVFKKSTADNTRVDIRSYVTGNTRFAVNELTTVGDISNTSISVTCTFGAKHASASTNDLSDDGLQAAVARSASLAKLAPDDPEAMPPLGPQHYEPVDAYFDSTAQVTAEDRARAALTALEPARASGADGIQAAGYIEVGMSASLVANTVGLSAYHQRTSANYTLTARTADGTGSGWAGADHQDWSKLSPRAVAEHALAKARASRKPAPMEPGRYTVILEPQAVGDLVQLMMGYIDARSADEGRSPFVRPSGGSKIGDRVVDARVTVMSDPRDSQLLSSPYDGEGFPLGRQVWIEGGVLKQLSYTRFWAKKQGKPYTGIPGSIKVLGGNSTREEMIRSTELGILVTRFWYLREVDPRSILYTGLTRDGTFLIEHGAITTAIKNFRFNDSPLFLLNSVDALGKTERLAGTEEGGDIAMPIIKSRDFNFTSVSDAI